MAIPLIHIRNLVPDDIVVIRGWAPYQSEFEDLDYALRENGWLTEFWNKPDAWCFAVEQADDLIAFSILSRSLSDFRTGETEAEFRIALRVDRTGQGHGRAITAMTLAKGFIEIGLSRINLIVRTHNLRAIRLYTRLGFTEQGECFKSINRKQTHFLIMELRRESYFMKGLSK